MRVLIAVHSSRSYLFAMVPLAWALRTAGHEVRVATQPALVDSAADTGLTVVAVGEDHRFDDLLRGAAERSHGDQAETAAEPEALASHSWQDLAWLHNALVCHWLKTVNDPMLDDLVSLCGQWEPDLVLWEPTTLAGGVAAQTCGAVHGRFLWSRDVLGGARTHFLRLRAEQEPEQREDPLGEWLAARAHRHGIDYSEDLVHGQFTVGQLPPSLQEAPATQREHLDVRYVHYGGHTTIPRWLYDEPRPLPRVLVDWRAVQGHGTGPRAAELRAVVAGLERFNLEAVLAVGEDEEPPTEPPGVAHAVQQGALHAVAPTCQAIVHTGGFDTFCLAGAHGLPQLVIPEPELYDAAPLARAVAAMEAGRMLQPGDVSPESVAKNMDALIHSPAIAAGARRLREDAAAVPTPDLAAERLERLAADLAARA